MKTNDFLANLLQTIGFVAAIIIALSQYVFGGEFKQFFLGNESLYSVSNLVSLVLSLAIIIALYSFRYSLENRNYFNQRKRDDYWRKLKEIREQKQDLIISEPWYWTVSNLGFVLIIITIILFCLMLVSPQKYLTTLSYILFVCSSVSALTIFSLKIYLVQEFKNLNERIRQQIMDKINEYFVGDLSIITEFEDRSNFMYPVKTFIIMKDEKKYVVRSDANDPNRFFSIEPIKEQ